MNLDPDWQLGLALCFTIVVMGCLWFNQRFTRDAGIVDVGWSGSLGILAIFYGVTTPHGSWRTAVVAGMAAIWSFRLAIHLLRDRILGKSEDRRYQRLRTAFGSREQLCFFVVFQAQALLAWAFSLPFWLAMRRTGDLDEWDVAGIAVWVVVLIGETLSDSQLARFRADPGNRGKTCRRGLWRYSRHPNYFCEWLYWWSYVAIGWTAPLGWTMLFFPLLMLFFLFKVSGIPATEAQALMSRGDDYRDYQRTTSMFVPWFPGKST
jgi:steroid 5-alpha reductase family enzyme